MKNIYKILFSLFVVAGMYSCTDNDDINFVVQEPTPSFTIASPLGGSTIVLDDTNVNNKALTLIWEDTKSGEETVDYTVQFALSDTEFASPINAGSTAITNFSWTVQELNTILLDELRIAHNEASTIEVRISASNQDVSNNIALIVTPHVVEVTELYVNGNFTDWDATQGIAMTLSDFNTFKTTIELAEGDEFNFIESNTSDEISWKLVEAGSESLTKFDGVNVSGLVAGKYDISVNLVSNTVSFEQILAPNELFLVGSLTGWDPATSLPFEKNGDVFTIVANLPSGAEFKFLPQNTGWDGDWGEDPANPGSIIQDGEQNISGYAEGNYLITVDFTTLTFNLSSVENLYLVGSLTGWDPATSIEMGKPSLGVFSTIIDLSDSDEFKFLPQNTGWDGDWGENSGSLGSIIHDGEQNLSGYAAGKYVVVVDFNTLSFTISAVSEVPSSLYLVGSFNGWNNDLASPQFTETSSGIFEITQTLSGGDEFKFVPVAGDWGNDWGESKISLGVLEQGDENNATVTTGGDYTITVNFNNGTLSVIAI